MGKTEGCGYAEFDGCAVFLGWEVIVLVHYGTGGVQCAGDAVGAVLLAGASDGRL